MSGATRPYVVQQGDYLAKLAERFRFDADAVWALGANAALRAKRKPDQLCAGDVLHIPEKPAPAIALECGVTNSYTAAVPRAPVNLVFEVDGKPIANEPCVVEGLGAPLETQTDGSGALSLSVPVIVREVTVRLVKRNVVHAIRIGDMDPIEEDSGVAQRLVHLCLLVDRRKDESEAVADAIRRFQQREALRITGEANDETRAALVRIHGS